MNHILDFLLSTTVVLAGLVMPVLAQKTDQEGSSQNFSKADIHFFETKIRPIFEANCMECHGSSPDELGGGLALISRRSILEGGDSGPAIDLDHVEESVLLDAINYGDYEMPPSGQLSKEEIGLITQWANKGMPWPEAEADKVIDSQKHSVPQVNAETKAFWSFQPVAEVSPPDVKDSKWISNEIDKFILNKLEAASLFPAAKAAKEDLIRRACYDLTGLPPTHAEVVNFINDDSEDAYQSLIDRLLDSPHYGEKWARHWLDVVRYAESNSFERDGTKPFVWRYRDYVIKSFNEDKPYDQFLTEQLAGDELENPSNDAIIATGYYRLGQWDDEPADSRQAVFDDLDDILATTSQAMMGLTVNCARCHDHKIDPVPQKDYYRMLAFFRNIKRYGVRFHDSVEQASVRNLPRLDEPSEEELKTYDEAVAKNKRLKKEIVDIAKKDFSPVEHEEFAYERNHERLVHMRIKKEIITQKQFDQFWHAHHNLMRLRKENPTSIRVLCVKEDGKRDTHVLVRGNAGVEGEKVEPGFPTVLSPPDPRIKEPASGKSSGRRLAFAKWLTRSDHPLAARVMVNRIWQHHFGRGIVRSSNDFGLKGEPPSHPELLDYLAKKFVQSGWKVKALHREIMLSSTYQMSSNFNQSAFDTDPLNNLFWRFDMRRLTAEEVRDSILAINGRLNKKKMYGPSVFTKLSSEVLAGQSIPGAGWGGSSPEDQRRRSIYIHVKRSLRVPLLSNFDVADTDATCPVRFNTTQPTQALGLLNSRFTNEEAAELAKLVSKQHSLLKDQVGEILQRATQKDATEMDLQEGVNFVERLRSMEVSDEDSLAYFCLMAINLNEFIFLK